HTCQRRTDLRDAEAHRSARVHRHAVSTGGRAQAESREKIPPGPARLPRHPSGADGERDRAHAALAPELAAGAGRQGSPFGSGRVGEDQQELAAGGRVAERPRERASGASRAFRTPAARASGASRPSAEADGGAEGRGPRPGGRLARDREEVRRAYALAANIGHVWDDLATVLRGRIVTLQ